MSDLAQERQKLEQAWALYVHDKGQPELPTDLKQSWKRSSRFLSPHRPNVSIQDPQETDKEWRDSLLYAAAKPLLDEIQQTAELSGYVVAICDGSGKLLWTHSSRHMQRRAEGINFVAGGLVNEASAGTNALDLALRRAKPAKVFSAEHYMQAFHDWVCYSAPIRDPQSGFPIGVLDFSSTWDKANAMGLMTATALAHYIEQRMLTLAPKPASYEGEPLSAAPLRLKLCGAVQATLERQRLDLSPRQLEILALLALHPEGLSLTTLHHYLYGDQDVSSSTLKAEVSVLRHRLKGDIGSRPYQLKVNTWVDALDIQRALEMGHLASALHVYGGLLMPDSESPRLSEWRNYLDSALRDAVLSSADADLMWRYSAKHRDDFECLLRLTEYLPPGDSRLSLIKARIRLLQDDSLT